ncbi:MAG TPA: sigma factor-like helix-turn-helix DNA-binding protein, partial [Gemmata sp.]|nr:sigma factor-like helix-turn-helix DNA-binding protein [Gemmata sp.]
RERYERQAAPAVEPPSMGLALRELQVVLDEEVQRLPAKYRTPFVLCCLEGRSRKEVADELGWKDGTVSSRIAQARRRLQLRLARRGVTLSAAMCAVAVGRGTASSAVPSVLAGATASAAPLVAAGQGDGAVPAHVLALTDRMVYPMLITMWKVTTPVILLLALVGGGLVASLTPAAEQPRPIARSFEPEKKEPRKIPPREADLLKQAAEAAQAIDNRNSKVWVLLSIAEAQARTKDKDASAKSFSDAIEVAKGVDGFEKEHRLMDVVAAQARAGDVKRAKETAELIMDNLGTRDNALSKVAIAQARAGDLAGAEDTIASVSTDPWKGEALRELADAQAKAGRLKEATKTAAGIDDDLSRVVALLTVARAQRSAKDDNAAAILLQKARKIVESIEEDEQSDTRAVATCALTKALVEAGNVKDAREMAGAVKKESWKAVALLDMAATQALAGDVKGAMETAEAIKDESQKERALKDVVVAQLRAGDLKGALKTLEPMKRPYWRAEALAEIAKTQAKDGDSTASRKTFEKAFAEAEGVQEMEGAFGNAANACYAHIVGAMAEVGQERDAADWASLQTDPIRKAQSLLYVAQGMALRKETEKRAAEKK